MVNSRVSAGARKRKEMRLLIKRKKKTDQSIRLFTRVMEGYSVSFSEDKRVRLEVGLVRDEEGSVDGTLHVRVTAVEPAKRTPVNVICLVDTSGSMNNDVVIQNAKGESEVMPLNLLDLARHAVATVAHGLNKDDMLGIIGWATEPNKEMPVLHMDKDGQKKADELLNKMYPDGSTGMIQALNKGFSLVVDNGHPNIIFLLTDGQPDEQPAGGFGPFVRNLMDSCKVPVQLNTLGFGYSVDSKLLCDIAEAGRGTFSFIPDGGLLGTVIVNSIANTVAVALSDAQVSIDLCDGVSFAENALRYPKGSMDTPVRSSDGTVAFNIGAVNYEQPRSVVLPVKLARGFAATAPVASVSVSCSSSGKRVNVIAEDAVTTVLPRMRLSYAQAACARAKTVFADTLFAIVHERTDSLEAASAAIKACAAEVKKLQDRVGASDQIRDILRDCEGQATEAVSKQEWFNRWGMHYLRSLCGAHEYELCNNFKDPGVQHYGGPFFASVRDDLDDIFQKLPPPEPHPFEWGYFGGKIPDMYGFSTASSARSRRVVMSRFMDASAGCFGGSCLVTLADGTSKRVCEVRKGDVLRTGSKSEPTATVVATIQASSGGNDVCLFKPSGLIITPYHPIDLDGNDVWSFPANCSSASQQQTTTEPLFTFVLGSCHSVLVSGVRCVTLAHGVTSGSDARAHPYFGSDACIDDLEKYFADEYAKGFVTLPANCKHTRDPKTNLVNGISML